MRDAIEHRAAADGRHIKGEAFGWIGHCGDLFRDYPGLNDRIGAVRMLATSVGSAAFDCDPPGGPAFTRQHHQTFVAQPSFGFEDERRDCVLVETAAAKITKIR